jgi:hypothetical protein
MKGRIQWETAFFGLLAAVGLPALLVAMLLGGLFAVGAIDSGETAADQVRGRSELPPEDYPQGRCPAPF